MSEFRKVITMPGEVLNYETVFEENPYLRTGVPEKMGTVERIDYTTAVYENGKTYNKTAYVYLPYCYDKNDKSKKYNVLYFQHGNTCDPTMFALGGNKYMFDMLFDSGELDPCIIVFVTYYMDPMRDADIRTQTGGAESCDGWTPGIPGNYHIEIVQDIIPAVEMKYNTYLEDPSDLGIKATRDHRAFSGYSRGGAWTWRMFHHAFEYFRWFCPTSGGISCDTPLPMPPGSAPFPTFTDEEILDYITAPIKAHPDLPFFIYAASGGKRDGAGMRLQMKLLTDQDYFSYGDDPTKNNIYYSLSDYYHTDHLVPYYFWNYLKVLFKI
jgi:enterochelin esterase-like enzyme